VGGGVADGGCPVSHRRDVERKARRRVLGADLDRLLTAAACPLCRRVGRHRLGCANRPIDDTRSWSYHFGDQHIEYIEYLE
jgi:hypothetical protein